MVSCRWAAQNTRKWITVRHSGSSCLLLLKNFKHFNMVAQQQIHKTLSPLQSEEEQRVTANYLKQAESSTQRLYTFPLSLSKTSNCTAASCRHKTEALKNFTGKAYLYRTIFEVENFILQYILSLTDKKLQVRTKVCWQFILYTTQKRLEAGD